ncbi:hypothetical protein D3C76_1512950 [compost metagenome]
MFQLARTETGLFLELPVGRRQYVFAWLDQALGQGQFVGVGATAILFHQHRVIGIEHRHDHHRAVARPLARQTFIGALHTVGKPQFQFFHAKQAAGSDDPAIEYGGFLAHKRLPGR